LPLPGSSFQIRAERDVSMGTQVRIPIGLRVLAFVCRICPCCVIARRWPDSAFAGKFRKVQRHCPFCRGHEKVRQIIVQAEAEHARELSVAKGGPAAATASGGQTAAAGNASEKRSGGDRRSGRDRRRGLGGYTGPERRSGKDRRSQQDRRQSSC